MVMDVPKEVGGPKGGVHTKKPQSGGLAKEGMRWDVDRHGKNKRDIFSDCNGSRKGTGDER